MFGVIQCTPINPVDIALQVALRIHGQSFIRNPSDEVFCAHMEVARTVFSSSLAESGEQALYAIMQKLGNQGGVVKAVSLAVALVSDLKYLELAIKVLTKCKETHNIYGEQRSLYTVKNEQSKFKLLSLYEDLYKETKHLVLKERVNIAKFKQKSFLTFVNNAVTYVLAGGLAKTYVQNCQPFKQADILALQGAPRSYQVNADVLYNYLCKDGQGTIFYELGTAITLLLKDLLPVLQVEQEKYHFFDESN